LRAGRLKLAHQRQRIDLGLQRHEAGDDGAGLDRKRKAARRDRLGGLRTLGGRNRIAPDHRILADDGFQTGDGVGHLFCAVVMPVKAGIQ
jgi:hypothetical protein